MPTTRPPTSKRKSRADWLAAGLEMLRREGIAAVRVERLAKKMGVTKGSFYWHFKDRDDLLRRMLEYWDEVLTLAVRDKVEQEGGSSRERLWRLASRIVEDDAARYDLAIRAWASFDRTAARVVRRVDEERLDYLRSLFRGMGFRGRQVELRARMFFASEIAEPGVQSREKPADRAALRRLRHELLTER